ncbi:MAG: hypothetical protein EOP40_10275 [Rubrivivax sp.]|nr:MAG: hypothetical protein EOP40_10275 [Rubrivivax sp.]
MTSTWLLNALTLAVVLGAALYVLRYAARLMGLRGWWLRQKGQEDGATASAGGCAPGGCGSCSHRQAQGKPQSP